MFIVSHSIAAIPEFVYRRVILQGTWDHTRSMLLGPRVLDGTNGFHLITPLVRTNGSTILVDRGFISEVAAAKRKYPTPGEVVEVHGMLRESQARNNFTPDNNPAKGEWYWVDVAAMSVYAGGESSNVQPVLVEEIFGKLSCPKLRRVFKIFRGSCWGCCYARVQRNSSRQSACRGHTKCARVICCYLVKVELLWLRIILIVHRYSLSALTTAMFIRLCLRHRQTSARLPRR
jgi:surfeit locus 1 family protein